MIRSDSLFEAGSSCKGAGCSRAFSKLDFNSVTERNLESGFFKSPEVALAGLFVVR
jgi:hypothetical protein